MLIVIGGFDQKIHVYALNYLTNDVTYHSSLTGHANSIRDLAFHNGNEKLLVSCSQDKLIRLWAITELTDPNLINQLEKEEAEVETSYDQY
jgi:WD40 repeat protein